MTSNMTPRQSKLLKAIIDEFIDSAEAVGSVSLANKYRLGVSPATIRNEMADLVKQGYLEKPHSSSGRVPTTMGFKYFIDRLLQQLDELDVSSSHGIKEDLFQNRFNTDQLIYQALNVLAKESNNLALAILSDRVYYAGLSNFVGTPDYIDRGEISAILSIIEDFNLLKDLFSKYRGENKVRILIGEDTGHGSLANTALIFSPIKMHGNATGYLALLGPNRMNYAKNIPLVDFIADSLNDVISGW
jgi:heat-inducible transcriptional repressor